MQSTQDCQRHISGCLGTVERGKREGLPRGTRKLRGLMGIFIILTMMMVYTCQNESNCTLNTCNLVYDNFIWTKQQNNPQQLSFLFSVISLSLRGWEYGQFSTSHRMHPCSSLWWACACSALWMRVSHIFSLKFSGGLPGSHSLGRSWLWRKLLFKITTVGSDPYAFPTTGHSWFTQKSDGST